LFKIVEMAVAETSATAIFLCIFVKSTQFHAPNFYCELCIPVLCKEIERGIIIMEKTLLSVPETMRYLGLGRNTVLRLLREEPFGCQIGSRLYANRVLLDQWLERQCRKDFRR